MTGVLTGYLGPPRCLSQCLADSVWITSVSRCVAYVVSMYVQAAFLLVCHLFEVRGSKGTNTA
jgi:hypothetical protein